jgi:hypothetical protein
MSPRIEALLRRPSKKLIDQVEHLVDNVVDGLDRGDNCDALIGQINQLTSGTYGPVDFFELYAAQGSREWAEAAVMGMQAVITDMTRDELIDLMKLVSAGKPADVSFFTGYLQRCFPGSFTSDLIFYPHRSMTPEETADELLLRESLFRSGGAPAVHVRLVELARAVLADTDAPIWAVQWAEGIVADA